ncbi:MAG: DUF2341 domain-containing protein, partial [Spirochaetia bacterium]|nr:DUF2341 domain-containing protein [Spirochaetia bacterium]
MILAPGWWDKSWNKRIKIMFSGNISTSNLVEFPVLITLNGSDLSYSDFNTDGSDIRFVDEDSMTVLSHE